MHMQTQKLNQQANECTIDCARHIVPIQTINNMQKLNKPKKCTTNFVNTKRKKDVTTQRKKQKCLDELAQAVELPHEPAESI